MLPDLWRNKMDVEIFVKQFISLKLLHDFLSVKSIKVRCQSHIPCVIETRALPRLVIWYQRYHFRLSSWPQTTVIEKTFSRNGTCIVSTSQNFVTILIILHIY